MITRIIRRSSFDIDTKVLSLTFEDPSKDQPVSATIQINPENPLWSKVKFLELPDGTEIDFKIIPVKLRKTKQAHFKILAIRLPLIWEPMFRKSIDPAQETG